MKLLPLRAALMLGDMRVFELTMFQREDQEEREEDSEAVVRLPMGFGIPRQEPDEVAMTNLEPLEDEDDEDSGAERRPWMRKRTRRRPR